MTTNWPRYEPVVFTTAIDVSPEDLDTLNRARLPRSFLGEDMVVDAPLHGGARGRVLLFSIDRGGSLHQ